VGLVPSSSSFPGFRTPADLAHVLSFFDPFKFLGPLSSSYGSSALIVPFFFLPFFSWTLRILPETQTVSPSFVNGWPHTRIFSVSTVWLQSTPGPYTLAPWRETPFFILCMNCIVSHVTTGLSPTMFPFLTARFFHRSHSDFPSKHSFFFSCANDIAVDGWFTLCFSLL